MDARTPPVPLTEGPFAHGSFWPGSRDGLDAVFEAFDDFLILAVRHIPTRAALDRALDLFGPGAGPLLTRWTRLWKDAVGDVDTYAASIEYVETWDRTASRLALCEDRIATLSAAGRRHEAADILAALHVRGGDGLVRDPAFHVLEDATALLSMLETGLPVRFALSRNGSDEPELFMGSEGDGTHEPGISAIGPDHALHAETLGRWKHFVQAQNPNWMSDAFVGMSGRETALCRGLPMLAATLLDMAMQGHGKAFLKHAVHKRGTWIVGLAGVDSYASACAKLSAVLGPAFADIASDRCPDNAMAVQEFVPFGREHRFFVVDHRVVASTPSDRSLSALGSAAGRILRPGVARLLRPPGAEGRYDRGESVVEDDRDLLARMAAAVRSLSRALRDEGIFPPHYVVDMGEADGAVLPIEVNTFANAGRYGLDYGRVARSMARWYADPSGSWAYARKRRPGYRMDWSPMLSNDGIGRIFGAVAALARATGASRLPSPQSAMSEADARNITMAWFAAVSAGDTAKGA